MKKHYLHKHWERAGVVKLATYTADGTLIEAFRVARADLPDLDLDGLEMISAIALIELQRRTIDSLITDRHLLVAQVQIENSKSRGWDGRQLDHLASLIADIDQRLVALEFAGDPQRHLMAMV